MPVAPLRLEQTRHGIARADAPSPGLWPFKPKVGPGSVRRHKSAWGAGHESFANEKGLCDFFDCLGLFADRHRQGTETHRASSKALAEGAEDRSV